MKKISEILKYVSCFALSLMLMTSCDKEADKLKIETETLNYSGTFYMLLYSTDMNNSEESIFSIDIDTVPGNIKIDISNEGHAVVDFVPGREIKLTIPFLDRIVDDNGKIIYAVPMQIYESSPITKLYYAIYEDVNVTDDEKSTFREMIADIKNTITIAPFKTSRIPLVQQGAAIVSYDVEQNSFFSSYTLGDVEYSYQSNLAEVIKYVRQNLLSKMAADKRTFANEAIQAIENIASSVTGKMNNAWGRLTMQYMNYYCDYDMRIQSDEERPNEMLVNISRLLYGEKNGKPNKDLWFLIEYTGHMGDSNFDWVEQREE